MTSPRSSRSTPLVLLGLLGIFSCNKQVLGQTSSCPPETAGSIYHCNNPGFIDTVWEDDPEVDCDPVTCEWRIELLSSEKKPDGCGNLDIIRASDPIFDMLEPCLLWELIYGEFVPTASPTLSQAPSMSPQPSAAPTSQPSVSPSFKPTTNPTAGPTWGPTSTPTAMEKTPPPTTMPSRSPTSAPVIVPDDAAAAVVVTKDFNDVLLTYIFPVNNRRRTLRALQQTLTMRSRAELFVVTEAHLETAVPNLRDLNLVLTPYQEYGMEGQIAVTEMLQGSLSLLVPADQVDKIDVEALLLKAFSGNALFNYLERLRMTSDEQLARTLDVSYGFPSGVPDVVANPSQGDGDSEGDGGFSLSGLWIGILACGTVGMIGLLAVGVVVLTRSSDQFHNDVGLKTTNTGTFTNGSPTSMEPQLIRRMQSVDEDVTPRGEGIELKLDDDELPEITREEDVVFNDMQSEITSVYSFVDRTGLNESMATDDQSYSLAPSYLMRKTHGTGEDEQCEIASPTVELNGSSVLWSVMDGLGSPNETKKSTVENSPSRLVISATPQQDENDVYIFNDDVSLVSETSEMMGSKITVTDTDGTLPPSPICNKSLDISKDNASTVDETETAKETVSQLASVLRPKENKNPLADLSRVMETSESSRNTSRVSSDGRRSAPTSAKKNRSRLSERSKEESTSTDDDSSLFMGPDSFAKENTTNRLLSLGEDDKVAPSEKKSSYSIAPLYRTSSRLSEKDKKHLGINRNPSRDDSSLGESMLLPGSYAMADFRDDMSISTAGDRSRKYSAATMASF